MTVGSNPSFSSLAHRKPRMVDTNWRPSWLTLKRAEAIGPRRSNSYTRIRGPQRVKARTKRRVSWLASTSLTYLPISVHAKGWESHSGLLFSSPGTRIWDQCVMAPGWLIMPTSSLRFAVEPPSGLDGFATNLRRGAVGARRGAHCMNFWTSPSSQHWTAPS